MYNTITIKSLVYTTEMHNTALRLEMEFSLSNSFTSNPSTVHLTSKERGGVLSDVQGERSFSEGGWQQHNSYFAFKVNAVMLGGGGGG